MHDKTFSRCSLTIMPGQEGVVQPKSRCSFGRKYQFDEVEDQSHCPVKTKTGRITNTRSKIDFVIAAHNCFGLLTMHLWEALFNLIRDSLV